MNSVELKTKLKKQVPLLGTFVRTPSIEIVELLAVSNLDFVILDAEHFPFDRSRIDYVFRRYISPVKEIIRIYW